MWLIRTFFLMVILSGLLLGCGTSPRRLSGWTENVVEAEYQACRATNYLGEDRTQNRKACQCWVNQMSATYSYEQAVRVPRQAQAILRQCFNRVL